MPRYIDADALKDDILNQLNACKYIFGNSLAEEIEESMVGVYMTIDRQPTADVAPVVHCKDCKYWDNNDDANRCKHESGGMWAKPNAFCSYAERRA